MNTCQRHPLSYFSIYELPESFGARVYRNNCQFTKAHARDQKSGEEVWILGTPMKEKEMMPFDRYLNCLRTIVRSLPGVTVVYIPHRAENGETLERLQAAVPVAVRRLGTAVEFHLARTSVIPRAVCGFFSSALFSVSRLFEGRIDVRAYYIPPEWLGRRHRAGISGAYEYFRSYGGPALRVVDLELTGV
jgi:hypothetical protein